MILQIECGLLNKNIDVFCNIRVLELRQHIANLFELKLENFGLKYAQVFLIDEKYLSVYEISDNSVVRVVNQKIDLKIINKQSEVLLKQLDINMKVGDLKMQYSPTNWENLKFCCYYEFDVDNPNKKKIDMKIVDEKLNIKTMTTEQQKEELRKKYLRKYHGDRLYYFRFINLDKNERTLAEHYMNDNYKIYITFQVFIKYLGMTYAFDVFDKLRIYVFKERIKNKVNKSILDLELTFNGETLKDWNVIGDYEIKLNEYILTTPTVIGGV